MAPADYNQARKQNLRVAWVDERPFLPLLLVQNDEASVKRAVAHIMMLLIVDNSMQRDVLPDAGEIEALLTRLIVEPITGGITNTLYKVSGLLLNNSVKPANAHSFPVDTVLLRVFGAEGMIDRDNENSVYAALSAARIAPAYYGRFANGRIEGWMDNMRALATTELSRSNIASGIAASLANLHVGFAIPADLQTEPSLWTQLDDWLNQAEKAMFQTKQETAAAEALQLAEMIRPELAWLKEQVVSVIENMNEAVVFCHNDMLAANILYDEHSDRIQLIDFEYGGVNYRAFDIANHFNEYAGGPPDHADPDYTLLPDTAQQRKFIRTYLQAAATVRAKHHTTQHTVGEDIDINAENLPAIVTEDHVDAMMPEVQIFLLANHFYWGLWAANQAATEGCAVYDYMQYASKRIQQYWITKRDMESSAL